MTKKCEHIVPRAICGRKGEVELRHWTERHSKTWNDLKIVLSEDLPSTYVMLICTKYHLQNMFCFDSSHAVLVINRKFVLCFTLKVKI